MFKEFVIAFAKIVQTGIAVAVFEETVLGAFAVTGKLITALTALSGQRAVFHVTELLLFFAVEHLNKRIASYISKLVFRKHKMIT